MNETRPDPLRGDDYRCGACGGAVPDHVLRASTAHPLGEADCPRCGSRVAWLGHRADYRRLVPAALIALVALGVALVLPDMQWASWVLWLGGGLGIALVFRARSAGRVLTVVPGNRGGSPRRESQPGPGSIDGGG